MHENTSTAAPLDATRQSVVNPTQEIRPTTDADNRNPDKESPMEPDLNLPEDRPRDLPNLLRTMGALVVALSLSAFLFQGWDQVDDLQRYLMLLGQSVLLALLGIGCERLLREAKGARTFFVLALVAVPINFAIVGALLFAPYAATLDLPTALTWRAEDPGRIVTVGALALPLLAAGTLYALRRLTMGSVIALGALFLLLNGLLLVPTREPAHIAWLLLVASVAAVVGARIIGRDDPTHFTVEGRLARALLFVPALILAARNLWLHAADQFLLTAAALSLFLLMRAVTLELPATSAWRRFLEPLSLLPAILTASGVAALLTDVALVDGGVRYTLALLTLSALLLELSTRTVNRPPYRGLAALTAGGGLSLNLLLFGGLINAFTTLIVGVALIALAILKRQRTPLVLGALAAASGLLYLTIQVFTLFHLGTWSGLALLGIAAIIAASLIERHGGKLRDKSEDWKERFWEWEL